MNQRTPSRTSHPKSRTTDKAMSGETRIIRNVLRTIAVLIVVYAAYLLGAQGIMYIGIWMKASSIEGAGQMDFRGTLGQFGLLSLIINLFTFFLGYLLFQWSGKLAQLITKD